MKKGVCITGYSATYLTATLKELYETADYASQSIDCFKKIYGNAVEVHSVQVDYDKKKFEELKKILLRLDKFICTELGLTSLEDIKKTS